MIASKSFLKVAAVSGALLAGAALLVHRAHNHDAVSTAGDMCKSFQERANAANDFNRSIYEIAKQNEGHPLSAVMTAFQGITLPVAMVSSVKAYESCKDLPALGMK